MKMEMEFEDTDPAQVSDGLVRMLALALAAGVEVEVSDGSFLVTNPGEDQCVRRWVGPDGEFRRDILERQWIVKESTDVAGRKLPAAQ